MPNNNLKTILHIVGNRPQFIKLAVLYNELAKDSNLQQKIIHTGQHYSPNMSDIFFDELNIPQPDINFNIQNASPTLFIDEAVKTLKKYFLQQINAIVFVYGDTNTTLAAAKAAASCALPLIHFEAGVRTYDKAMPEEINRVATDKLANVNYCCTEQNVQTLQQEKFDKTIHSDIILTGDLMLDAFLKIKASHKKMVTHEEYVVCTIHREANLSSKANLSNIIAALNKIDDKIPVVMPVHPHTQKKMEEHGIVPSFTLLPPLGYPDMKSLLLHSSNVITDSGGTSREAYFLQKKSLIIMDKPFWPEILEQQCSINTAAIESTIIEKFNQLPSLLSNFGTNIFGQGNAAENIRQHLSAYLSGLQ
jgi:UDP-GlcNAc3NAcA epimerase